MKKSLVPFHPSPTDPVIASTLIASTVVCINRSRRLVRKTRYLFATTDAAVKSSRDALARSDLVLRQLGQVSAFYDPRR